MAKVKVLDKKVRKEGKNLVIKKTTEETLNIGDFDRELQGISQQKEQTMRQFKQIKQRWDMLIAKEVEILELKEQLPEEEMEL